MYFTTVVKVLNLKIKYMYQFWVLRHTVCHIHVTYIFLRKYYTIKRDIFETHTKISYKHLWCLVKPLHVAIISPSVRLNKTTFRSFPPVATFPVFRSTSTQLIPGTDAECKPGKLLWTTKSPSVAELTNSAGGFLPRFLRWFDNF